MKGVKNKQHKPTLTQSTCSKSCFFFNLIILCLGILTLIWLSHYGHDRK